MRERARASEKPLILLRSKSEGGPFAAHATARCTRENFLCENRTRRKKKFFKRIGEREIDFGLRVPVSSKDSLSFKLGGAGTKIKKTWPGALSLSRSCLSSSFVSVRIEKDRPILARRRFRKPKARFSRLLFFLPFFPERLGLEKYKNLCKKGAAERTF